MILIQLESISDPNYYADFRYSNSNDAKAMIDLLFKGLCGTDKRIIISLQSSISINEEREPSE